MKSNIFWNITCIYQVNGWSREPKNFILLLLFFVFSRATPMAYGGSQARGLVGAFAAGLRQSHSNVGSEPHLRPTLQLMAMPDS